MSKRYKSEDPLLLAVDCIIFGFDGNRLKVLLTQRAFEPLKGQWSLLGGFVKERESVSQTANRVLYELTGMHHIYMEELSCFSEPGRDPGGRVVSVAYFALIRTGAYDDLFVSRRGCQWFDFTELPELVMDHNEMIQHALQKLRLRAASHPAGLELLPEKFTLSQLRLLYENIYDRPMDKRNFSRKVLSMKILHKLNEKETANSRKGSYLYVFDKQGYRLLDKDSFRLM
jgi:8-oxo-dGTP diphosphatase